MIKESKGGKVFNLINIVLMIAITLVIIVPLIYVVLNSFVSLEETVRRPFLIIPEKFDFTAYKLVLFSSSDVVNGYKITLFRVITGTFLNMLFSYFLAYSLSKKDFPGRNAITIYLFITMIFSGGLIPSYIIVKETGLLNNIWVYIIPGLISVWNVLLLRNFIMQIPDSLGESAEIDGASETIILFKIIMPLSIPAMVTIALFYAVPHWNSWFDAYIYVRSTKKFPIQMILRNILISSQITFDGASKVALSEMQKKRPPSRAIQNAVVVITTVPITIVYPFLQKYFVKGVMVGTIKG